MPKVSDVYISEDLWGFQACSITFGILLLSLNYCLKKVPSDWSKYAFVFLPATITNISQISFIMTDKILADQVSTTTSSSFFSRFYSLLMHFIHTEYKIFPSTQHHLPPSQHPACRHHPPPDLGGFFNVYLLL